MEQKPATLPPQPTDPSLAPPSQPQQQHPRMPPPSSSSSSPSTSVCVPSSPVPNPSPSSNPNAKASTPLPPLPQAPQPRPPFNRTWSQQSNFQHLPSNVQSPIPSSLSSSSSSSASSAGSSSITAPAQRGGMAIGVPAHPATPTPPPPASFSSFGQQYGGLGRNAVNASESMGTVQARQSMQGIQGSGMTGSISSSSQLRPAQHQLRPAHSSSLRPPSASNNPASATQNIQGHGPVRVPLVGSSGSPSPSTSQSLQSQNQPWLSSGQQGKPPLPSSPYRSITAQLQQRSHIPQQHHHPAGASQHQIGSVQKTQPSLPSHVLQEQSLQQFPTSRVPQSSSHQQQATRVLGSGIQKSSSATVQPSTTQSGPDSKTDNAETGECGGRLLGKRSIRELVSQIDPSEKLDPEVEDILVDIAEDFVESITTFGCSLAKHRKSNTLEARDILLHLERNWNITLPGFGGDEIKTYKKPAVNDLHRDRLAAIKRSSIGLEMASSKNSAGQAATNAKGHAAKASG